MGRRAFFFASCAVQVFVVSGLVWGLGAGFFDGFDAFHKTLWSKEEHELGRRLEAENVAVADGRLRMKLPARTWEGAEIDLELPNDSSRRIWFTTCANGRQTNHVERTLPSDPTAGAHNYTFRFTPDGVSFVVGGRRIKRFDRGLTRESMHLFGNAWYPQ